MIAGVDFSSVDVLIDCDVSPNTERNLDRGLIEESNSLVEVLGSFEFNESISKNSYFYSDFENYTKEIKGISDSLVASVYLKDNDLVDVIKLSPVSDCGINYVLKNFLIRFDNQVSNVLVSDKYYEPDIYVSAVAVSDTNAGYLDNKDVYSLPHNISADFTFQVDEIGLLFDEYSLNVLKVDKFFDFGLLFFNVLCLSNCDYVLSLTSWLPKRFICPFFSGYRFDEGLSCSVVYGNCDFGELNTRFKGDNVVLLGTTDFNIVFYLDRAKPNIVIPIPDVDYDVSKIVLPKNIEADFANKILIIKVVEPESQVVELKDTAGNSYYVKIIPAFNESRLQFKGV